MHATVELLLMVARGELPAEALAALEEEHVRELCPECGAEWQSAGAPEGEAGRLGPRPHAPHPPLPAVAAQARRVSLGGAEACRERLAAIQAARRQARRALGELLALPPADWPGRVASSRGAFHTRAFAELLLRTSRERVRTEPDPAGRLAALVPEVLRRVPPTPETETWPLALALRAEAHRANALRVGGDLPAADRVFAALRRRLAERAPDDPAVLGEIASLEASLRLDERRHAEAEELLGRALLLHRQAGDEDGRARALVKLGFVLRARGRLVDAVRHLQETLRRLPPDGDRVLRVSAVNCLALCHCDLGRYKDAGQLMADTATDFDHMDSGAIEAARRMTLGRIALGRGRPAAEEFAASRDGFLASDRAYDAALASLDLACAYLDGGDTAALRQLAADLVPAFRDRGVSREALAALGLLARAVAEERVTRAVLDEIRRRFEAVHVPAG